MVHRKSRGFTLIELLVVIAIIAILAAILLPVFARARENARKSTCQNNMKQIGTAVMQYTQDYDEILPKAWMSASGATYGVASDASNWKWMDSIQPYVKSEQVFNCPSNSSSSRYSYKNGSNYGAYRCNSAYWGGGSQNGPQGKSLAMIQAPTDTVWCADSDNGSGFEVGWQNVSNQPSITTSGSMKVLSNIAERHSEMLNVSYLDGHTKTMKLDKLAEKNATTGAYRYFSVEDD